MPLSRTDCISVYPDVLFIVDRESGPVASTSDGAGPEAGSSDTPRGSGKTRGAKASAPKAKKLSKAAEERQRLTDYRVPSQAASGRWERIASSVDELEAFWDRIKRSLKKPDMALAAKVRSGVEVPFSLENSITA